MRLINTYIKNLYIIEIFSFEDERGIFFKIFNSEAFKKIGIDFEVKEVFYSISKKNVIRGMHFQVPPYEASRIIHVIKGKIIDVVLDIRKNSPTYGNYFEIELSEKEKKVLFVPPGLAHGFKSCENNTIVMYLQSNIYHHEYDKGIKFDSFGYNWKCDTPIISERDKKFQDFKDFKSPF